jgi:NDP-sugar pyrophosphorylase family protein
MKAMILAAGLGTRLKHLTVDKPKALVEINGKTLLEHSIQKLTQAGVTDIIINVHHFAPLMIEFIHSHRFDANISISEESMQLLDTGGGIKKAAHFFNDNRAFFVYNVDIISDINLKEMYAYHEQQSALATLAVRERETQRYFLFDENMCLSGHYNLKSQEKIIIKETKGVMKPYAFSGIHILSPEIVRYFFAEQIFSITDFYLYIAKEQCIKGYIHNYGDWRDVGKLESLAAFEEEHT